METITEADMFPLAPCPWCGSDDVSDGDDANPAYDGADWESQNNYIVCCNCRARGPSFSGRDNPIGKSYAAWNRLARMYPFRKDQ